MSAMFQVHRYAAYFKGWCQAFGEHESVVGEEDTISWLFGEDQVGLILPKGLNKNLYLEVLGKRSEPPTLNVSQDSVDVGEFHFGLSAEKDKPGLDALQQILESSNSLHLYLTNHFMYQQGTRIVTFSRKQPLSIIYKEIGPLHIRLG